MWKDELSDSLFGTNHCQIKVCKRRKIYSRCVKSPGLVLMGIDSRSKGHGFKSRYRILDGHFSHLFVVKIVMCFEKTKINEKEAVVGPF